ncbi:MAG: hypothetical protein AVDCRST_MAG03-2667, partial [uncultured Rubrobacteraceae bacterium]
ERRQRHIPGDAGGVRGPVGGGRRGTAPGTRHQAPPACPGPHLGGARRARHRSLGAWQGGDLGRSARGAGPLAVRPGPRAAGPAAARGASGDHPRRDRHEVRRAAGARTHRRVAGAGPLAHRLRHPLPLPERPHASRRPPARGRLRPLARPDRPRRHPAGARGGRRSPRLPRHPLALGRARGRAARARGASVGLRNGTIWQGRRKRL